MYINIITELKQLSVFTVLVFSYIEVYYCLSTRFIHLMKPMVVHWAYVDEIEAEPLEHLLVVLRL